MLFLKQSTAVTVKIGPFLDDTDGKTAETGLTLSQADIRLSKNGGDIAQKNESSAATHDELGYYDCALDATDTGTLGRLQLAVHESGALPVWCEFMVLPANVYDSLILGSASDYLQVDVIQWKSATAAAMTGDAYARLGAPAGASLSADVADLHTDLDDVHTDVGTATTAIGDVHSTDLPDLHTDVAAVKTVVDAILVDTGTTLEADIDAILADTNELQTDLTNGGRLDLLIDAIKAKTDNLPANPADDSDIDAQLATIAGYLDTEVAAILADTNELQTDWTNGGRLDLLIDAILADTGTDGVAISTTGADAVLDEVVEGTLTVRQILLLAKSVLAGKSSGGGTATLNFRDHADTKNRVTATVDANGNRTAVTLDVS